MSTLDQGSHALKKVIDLQKKSSDATEQSLSPKLFDTVMRTIYKISEIEKTQYASASGCFAKCLVLGSADRS